uniref:DUF7044 domain-containing protein n=1 Tax=Magallana gigas TaxID=29159 RepID=K1QLK2_MAGGI
METHINSRVCHSCKCLTRVFEAYFHNFALSHPNAWVRRLTWACTFPKDWQGAWYQNVFGELTISETEISRKGVCTANVGNKYVVYSREQECYRCLVIFPWHQNVIQYKESE